MRKNKILTPQKKGGSNDFQTPGWVVELLLPYIPKEWVIWECAAGRGNLVRTMEEDGRRVLASDIITGHNFLKSPPPEYDVIVTNPPYSLKSDWIGHCYFLSKPFALLLPFTALETPFRQAMFRENGLQILFFDKRANFETPSGVASSAWFPVAWFTWGLNLPHDMTFLEVTK